MRSTAVLAIALVCACDQGAAKPTEIKNGLRMTYSLAEGSPDAAASIMQKRLDAAKIVGLARADGKQIVVDLAGADAERIAFAQELVGRVGRLEIKVVANGSELMNKLANIVQRDDSARERGIAVGRDRWRSEAGATFEDVYLTAADRLEAMSIEQAKASGCFRRHGADASGSHVRCEVTGRQQLERYMIDVALLHNLEVPIDHMFVFERMASDRMMPPSWRSYQVRRDSVLASNAIEGAQVTKTQTGSAIAVRLRDDAARQFGELTRNNVGKKLAILVDDKVVSAPIIQAAITSGRLSISLIDERSDSAAQLARALASGPLPARVVLETIVELKDGKVVPPPTE